jgi:CheY-like chemotaxis protein
VDDALSHVLLEHRNVGLRGLREAAYAFGLSLLHIRRLGADEFVSFVEKRHLDEESAPTVLGPEEFHALLDVLVPTLMEEATFSVSKHRGHGIEYVVQHPGIPNPASGKIPRKLRKAKKSVLYAEAADQVVQNQMWWLTRDLICAREMGMPLTLATSLQETILEQLQILRTGTPIALDLRLPVLDGIPPNEILRLRREEHEAFEKFRLAIKKAMSEPAQGGRSMLDIQQDIVDPELNALTQRLRTAERAFAKKAGYGVSLGVVTAVCGMAIGLVQILGAGVAAAIGAAVAAQGKLQDERREIQMSDMYFVWKATR